MSIFINLLSLLEVNNFIRHRSWPL